MSYSRYFKMATPMLTGTANKAATIVTWPTTPQKPVAFPSAIARTVPARPAANPPSSHFSCCRRSPDERR